MFTFSKKYDFYMVKFLFFSAFYVLKCSAFFTQIDILQEVYSLTFANSVNNTMKICTINV